ncbi:hypothetical protein AD05_2552 [Escherichia coli 5-366-08_S4_C2]|nr:hypothetical protein AD05_2552 [Escherichia coli 5-366-08_S4_C2]
MRPTVLILQQLVRLLAHLFYASFQGYERFFIVLHFFFTKNVHYLNALSEILFLSPVVSGRSGYFFQLFHFCNAEVLC